MNPTRQPSQYPRRVLLAVTGLSPQVVTETVYALSQAEDRGSCPTEVRLITTQEGAKRARLALLSEDPGWFSRVGSDYGLPPIHFDEDSIIVLRGQNGAPLSDIRTPEENQAMADLITEQVRELTADHECALHVSLAGGRKTMGFYLGYALSLFGRPQDRLSHVLVSEPFESCWDFFYPTPYERVIQVRDGGLVDTSSAVVTLAEIPFVSLRHGLPDALLDGVATFGDTVAAARLALGPAELMIDLRARRIRASGCDLALPPVELAFLSWLARRLIAGADPVTCPVEGYPEPEMAREYLSEYHRIIGEMGDDERTATRLSAGMDKAFFEQTKSRLNGKLRKRLGPVAEHYLVHGTGRNPKRYLLTLPVTAVNYI